MADEAPNETIEQTEGDAPAAQEPQPDPYEGLTAEEREALKRIDEDWKRYSAKERLAFRQFAEIGYEAARKPAEKREEPKDDKPKSKAKPAKEAADLEDDDPLSTVRAELRANREMLEAMRNELKQRDQVAERQQFHEALEAAILASDSTRDDRDAASLVRSAALAEWASAKAANQTPDVRAIIKAQIGKLEERDRKRGYVQGKIDSRRVAGESGAGRTPSEKKPKFNPDDMENGNYLRSIREEAGLS